MIIKQGIKWLWLGIFLLVACSPVSGELTESSSGGGASLQSGQVTTVPAQEVATEASVQPAPREMTSEAPMAETKAPVSPVVEARPIATEFQPSDPGAVQLGDGKPKLVEFFAFW